MLHIICIYLVYSAIISVISTSFLVLTKYLSIKYSEKLNDIPIPGELIAVFLSTILFSFYNPNNLIPGTSDSLIISHTV